jgi:hypothetical protein
MRLELPLTEEWTAMTFKEGLLLETSERQARQTLEIFTTNGLISNVVSSSELDATVVIGTKPEIKE